MKRIIKALTKVIQHLTKYLIEHNQDSFLMEKVNKK